MKTITNIAVFDNDQYLLALLTGYCYANHIALTAVNFNRDGINEVEKLKPVFVVVPLHLLNTANKSLETALFKRVGASDQVKICGLIKNPSDISSAGLPEWIDVSICNPFDISEIDCYLKNNSLLNNYSIEEKRHKERRSFADRREVGFNGNGGCGNKTNAHSDYLADTDNLEFAGFKIDQRNKCLFLNGHKVDLTPKEFELMELLSTDTDRIFKADEIINHLWPESSRATKSDLYQYMHLLRKKIEKDSNNPQWIMNVKGFGYKLNIAH